MPYDKRDLPPKARATIMQLADQQEQAEAASRSALNQYREIMKAHGITTDERHQLELKREADDRMTVVDRHREAHHALADLNAKIRRYLDMLPNNTILIDVKQPKLPPKTTYLKAVIELRAQVFKLISERGKTERAGLTIADIKDKTREWIAERANSGKPAIVATHDKFNISFNNMVADAYSANIDVLGFVAWFDPRALEKRLFEEIDTMPQPKFTMTSSDRERRLKEIKRELLDLERLEAAHIQAALDEGQVIPQRTNIDIRALLGIAVSQANVKVA